MASIWDTLFPKQDYRTAAPSGGYADLYANSLLGNRTDTPTSVGAMETGKDFIPGIGDAIALKEAYDAASRGDKVAAGLLAAGAAVGLIPGAGDAVARPLMAAGRKAADVASRIEVDPNAVGSMLGNVRVKPKSPAEEIAGLLSSGREDDVTDEMLSKLTAQDNSELFDLYQSGATGMDLPMDEASRMARAEAAGFEGGLLHGTGSDIAAVDKSKLGQKQNVLGEGFYSTTNPKRSNRYVPKENRDGELVFSDGGNVMPLMSRNDNVFDLGAPTGSANASSIGSAFEGAGFDVEYRGGGDQVFIKNKSNPDQSVYLDSYQPGQTSIAKLKDVFGSNNVTKIMEEAGFSGLSGSESLGSKVAVNYNPEDVRSRFARFDPRLAHLKNLSAGVGVAPIGLLALREEQKRANEEQYKRGLLQ